MTSSSPPNLLQLPVPVGATPNVERCHSAMLPGSSNTSLPRCPTSPGRWDTSALSRHVTSGMISR